MHSLPHHNSVWSLWCIASILLVVYASSLYYCCYAIASLVAGVRTLHASMAASSEGMSPYYIVALTAYVLHRTHARASTRSVYRIHSTAHLHTSIKIGAAVYY